MSKSFVFICYRRGADSAVAAQLFRSLSAHYPEELIFLDTQSIEPSTYFSAATKKTIAKSSSFLIIVGPGFSGDLHRTNSTEDYVRQEISYALSMGVPILPVLIANTRMPKSDDLPADISGIRDYAGIQIHDDHFNLIVKEKLAPALWKNVSSRRKRFLKWLVTLSKSQRFSKRLSRIQLTFFGVFVALTSLASVPAFFPNGYANVMTIVHMYAFGVRRPGGRDHIIDVEDYTIGNIEISPDNEKIFITSLDQKVEVRSLDTGRLLARLTGLHDSRIGVQSISKSGDYFSIYVNDINFFDQFNTSPITTHSHSFQITAANAAPIGSLIAFGDVNGGVVVYDVSTHSVVWSHLTSVGWIDGIAVSPDGNHVAYFGSGKFEVLNTGTQQIEVTGQASQMDSIEGFGLGFSHDGQKLIVGSETVSVLDIFSGEVKKLFDSEMVMQNADFAPDDKAVFFSNHRGSYFFDLEKDNLQSFSGLWIRSNLSEDWSKFVIVDASWVDVRDVSGIIE